MCFWSLLAFKGESDRAYSFCFRECVQRPVADMPLFCGEVLDRLPRITTLRPRSPDATWHRLELTVYDEHDEPLGRPAVAEFRAEVCVHVCARARAHVCVCL